MNWILPLFAIGCARPPVGILPDALMEGEDVDEPAVMWGYSWVEPSVLAAMPRPSSADLPHIAADGVDLLVTLTEGPLDPTALESAGLDTLHLPIVDFQAPTMEQMQTFVDAVETRSANGQSVGVHCLAGRGRSGTMAAVWFVHKGFDAEAAIARIRELRPGSIETDVQERAVHDFEAFAR